MASTSARSPAKYESQCHPAISTCAVQSYEPLSAECFVLSIRSSTAYPFVRDFGTVPVWRCASNYSYLRQRLCCNRYGYSLWYQHSGATRQIFQDGREDLGSRRGNRRSGKISSRGFPVIALSPFMVPRRWIQDFCRGSKSRYIANHQSPL